MISEKFYVKYLTGNMMDLGVRIRDIFYKVFVCDNEKDNVYLECAINSAEVISFDVFDTLVKRNVQEPKHVHKIVGQEFFRQTGNHIAEYDRLRVNAEKKARKCSTKEEICMSDIFDFMFGIPDEWKRTLQELEKQTEIKICIPNLKMKPIYEKALKAEKSVIITSDMYLDQETVRQILFKCGYDEFEKLYLSSTLGVCKAKGSIFEVIKKDYPVLQEHILHIGDHIKSDYFMPREKGINAILINKEMSSLKFWKRSDTCVKDQLLYQRLYSFLNNHVDGNNDYAISIGYEILGPMLWGFCRWLYEKIRVNKIDKIFFLSREGKIIQEAFNSLYPQCGVKQTYLYVSRQALMIPMLIDAANFDEMADTFRLFSHVPLVKIIPTLCSFDYKIFNNELARIGVDSEAKIDTLVSEKKEQLYSVILKLGKDGFQQQKSYIVKYLKENNFFGNIAIVDIGWSGSMQKALRKYVSDIDTNIRGYYLGVRNIKSDDHYGELSRTGYLFDCKKNENYNLMMRFTAGIIEMLFLNTEGSVLGYDTIQEDIIPILSEPEYMGVESDFMTTVQTEALKFLNIIKKDELFREELKVPEDIVMSAYSRFAVYPTLATLKVFEKFCFLNGTTRDILPDQGIFYYLTHIRKFHRDFRESSCKIFFLKKIFRINISYYSMLKFLLHKWDSKKES